MLCVNMNPHRSFLSDVLKKVSALLINPIETNYKGKNRKLVKPLSFMKME